MHSKQDTTEFLNQELSKKASLLGFTAQEKQRTFNKASADKVTIKHANPK